tara:strand:+ start:217 stop:543 length:327 start_codon:yes stop_codon:yes gene_type:complete
MPNQVIYFKKEIYNKLILEENMSACVDSALTAFFDKHEGEKANKKSEDEKKQLEDVADAMAHNDEMKKIEDFIKTMDKKVYLKGVKEGKWLGAVDYARKRLKLDNKQK